MASSTRSKKGKTKNPSVGSPNSFSALNDTGIDSNESTNPNQLQATNFKSNDESLKDDMKDVKNALISIVQTLAETRKESSQHTTDIAYLSTMLHRSQYQQTNANSGTSSQQQPNPKSYKTVLTQNQANQQ